LRDGAVSKNLQPLAPSLPIISIQILANLCKIFHNSDMKKYSGPRGAQQKAVHFERDFIGWSSGQD
jgi:hypothetical protein